MFLVQQIQNGQIVEGYDKFIRSNKRKCAIFEEALTKKNISVQWINQKQQPYQLEMNGFHEEIRINLYLSCVTYLGKPHPSYKKRMQLSDSANRKYLNQDNTRDDITLMIGLYLYDEEQPIFVAWDSDSNKEAGKSKSSHVFVNDILLAVKNGVSQRKDKYSHNVYCFKPEFLKDFIDYNRFDLKHERSFIEYLNQFGKKINQYMFLDHIYQFLKEDMLKKDAIWDGKKCVLEMKEHHYQNWAQTEWQGFYLEFLLQQEIKDKNSSLGQLLEMPGPKYGKTVIDGFYNIPWDFKVHVAGSNQIITNDMEAIELALESYGKIGFIIVSGLAEKEEDTEFSDWRNELKGGLSKNQLDNIQKNKKHRKLKTNFTPQRIMAITVDKEGLTKHGILRGLKNPNGNIRRDKLIIKLDQVTPEETVLDKELVDSL